MPEDAENELREASRQQSGSNSLHHHHHHLPADNIKTALILNFGFALVEIVGGFFSQSMALIADGVHDGLDALSIFFALLFEKKSYNPADLKFHYGYRRYSLFSALIMSVVLVFSSVLTVYIVLTHGLETRQINTVAMFLFSILGLAVNGYAFYRLSSGSSHQEKVISWHLLEDLLGWVATLIGSVVIHYTGWQWVDTALALLIAALIAFNGLKSFKKILPIFLQRVPEDVDINKLEMVLNRIDGIGESKLSCWTLDGERHVYNLKIKYSLNDDFNRARSKIYKTLRCDDPSRVFIERL